MGEETSVFLGGRESLGGKAAGEASSMVAGDIGAERDSLYKRYDNYQEGGPADRGRRKR